MARDNPATPPPTAQPWWRYGIVWLVVGGPLAVVVAGIVTAVIAVRGADPVVVERTTQADAQAPAVQARNHAATPAVAPKP